MAMILGLGLLTLGSAASDPAIAAAERQSLAVLEVAHSTGGDWWARRGAGSAQQALIASISAGRRYRVLSQQEVARKLSGNRIATETLDPPTAVKIGKLLGVNYVLAATVSPSGSAGGSRQGLQRGPTVGAQLIDTSTGEIVWADELGQDGGGRAGGAQPGLRAGDEEASFGATIRPLLEQLGTRVPPPPAGRD